MWNAIEIIPWNFQRVQEEMQRQQFPKCCAPRVDARPGLAHALGLWRALEAEVSQCVGGGQGVRWGGETSTCSVTGEEM